MVNVLLLTLSPQAMAYVHTVELATPDKRFSLCAKPSMLQTKLKQGRNRCAKHTCAFVYTHGKQRGSVSAEALQAVYKVPSN